jgi:hypothetical protein
LAYRKDHLAHLLKIKLSGLNSKPLGPESPKRRAGVLLSGRTLA